VEGCLGSGRGALSGCLSRARIRGALRDGPREPRSAEAPPAMDRRAFFRTTAIAGVSAVLLGVGARIVSATTSSITAVRQALSLPAPRSKVTIPDGAQLDIPGISPSSPRTRTSTVSIRLSRFPRSTRPRGGS
jgi:ferric-dicitrate binding protein FerR (iron transport regulator)